MVISLYTSRVVLQVLGVEDFGIYHSVGGVVGMFAFVNGALATGSSRFLTAELGTGNFEKLKYQCPKGIQEKKIILIIWKTKVLDSFIFPAAASGPSQVIFQI